MTAMESIKPFYCLSKLFGLCPFRLDGAVSRNATTHFVKQLLPSCLVLVSYTFCLVSIYWQGSTSSVTSNVANWIQVMELCFRKSVTG